MHAPARLTFHVVHPPQYGRSLWRGRRLARLGCRGRRRRRLRALPRSGCQVLLLQGKAGRHFIQITPVVVCGTGNNVWKAA